VGHLVQPPCRSRVTYSRQVRWLQTHCPQPLSLLFSLGKSTCTVPCRGNTVNFTIKLLEFIFSGYGIAASFLQVLKCLFTPNNPCSIWFHKLWDQRHTEPGRKSSRGVRVIFDHISFDHRRQTCFPSLARLHFHVPQRFLWKDGALSCSHALTWDLTLQNTASYKVLHSITSFPHCSSLRHLTMAVGTSNEAARS